jgi:Glyoxalase superfamily protein
MSLGKTVPILRMFDEAKAKEFYVDFLGFSVAGNTGSTIAPRFICRFLRTVRHVQALENSTGSHLTEISVSDP